MDKLDTRIIVIILTLSCLIFIFTQYFSFRSSESAGNVLTHKNTTLGVVKTNWIFIGSIYFSIIMSLIFGITFILTFTALTQQTQQTIQTEYEINR